MLKHYQVYVQMSHLQLVIVKCVCFCVVHKLTKTARQEVLVNNCKFLLPSPGSEVCNRVKESSEPTAG